VKTASERVKVVVADDQTLFRTVLSRMLASDPRVEVVGQARDGLEAIEATHELKPHVVLMDLQMPRLDGVAATRRLAAEAPDVRVLVLSAYADRSTVAAAIDGGAVGFIDKDQSFEHTLNRILESAPPRTPGAHRPRGVLSSRELNVLKQVASGLSNKQIAGRLGISERTVRNHLSRVFSKLAASNRTEAVMNAMRSGLVTA
jgi:DNA-binding NarL/FixJ family response regulator